MAKILASMKRLSGRAVMSLKRARHALPLNAGPKESLIENPEILEVLARIVSSLSGEPCCRQDLMQEALVHLWRIQQERPHESKSWYLQSCRFRLQHFLSLGRSVDSPKRRGAQVSFLPDDPVADEMWIAPSGEFQQTSAQDMVDTLARRLKPVERAVLDKLAEGLSTSEIARLLGLSCPTVTKHRRKIARVAQNLERAPLVRVPLKLAYRVEPRNGRWRLERVRLRENVGSRS